MKNFSVEKNIIDAVDKYSDTVFRIAFQYTRIRSDAEDVVQEVFLKLFKASPDLFVEDERLKAWLIRVTINKSKDYLRANKRRNKLLDNYVPQEKNELYTEVFEALAKLNETDRNVIYLHYYEGYTAREISFILGKSERAVTKRISRAREKLKDLLEE